MGVSFGEKRSFLFKNNYLCENSSTDMKRLIFTLIFAVAAVGSALAQDFRVRVVNQLQMPVSK